MRYNQWMTDPKLLQLTASEPLTLEEEYAMQESWCNDPKKCTFIILAKKTFQAIPLNNCNDEEIAYMCGDVNLFFNNIDNAGDAEIEIMIAEPDCCGKGIATEAVAIMMNYGIKIGVSRFYAKISSSNEASRRLFQK